MAKKTKLHIIRHYCNKAVSACTAVFGMAIVRFLSFFIDHARIWRYELTYKLHLKVRSFHDVLVLKSPVYKKVTENGYAVPVRNAAASAFLVSLLVFTSFQYLSPFFNPFKAQKAEASSTTKTWDTQAELQSATTNANIDSTTNPGTVQLTVPAYSPQGDGHDGAVTVAANKNLITDVIRSTRTIADGWSSRVSSFSTSSGKTTVSLVATPPTGTFNNNSETDEVMLISVKGLSTTNVGLYEFDKVSSVSSNVVTLTSLKTNYYGDGAANDTNVGVNEYVYLIRVPNYTDLTVNSGFKLTVSAWDGANNSGVMAFRTSGVLSVATTASIDVSGLGMRGGTAAPSCIATGSVNGEYYGGGLTESGARQSPGTGYTGGGGGGGGFATGGQFAYAGAVGSMGPSGGGGGPEWNTSGGTRIQGNGGSSGYGTVGKGGFATGANAATRGSDGSGTSGGAGGSGYVNGSPNYNISEGGSGGGGGTYGVTDLRTRSYLGTGGGAGGNYVCSSLGGSGGAGGGMVFVGANSVSNSGSILAQGSVGVVGAASSGGNGSGGSIILMGKAVTNSGTVSTKGGYRSVDEYGGNGRSFTSYMSYSGSSVADTVSSTQSYGYQSPATLGGVVAGNVGLRFDTESLYGTGAKAKVSTLAWTGTTGSTGQKLLFKVRAGDTQAELDANACYGPTTLDTGCADWATAGKFFSQINTSGTITTNPVTLPGAVFSSISSKRYIEVLVRMESDGTNTPSLDAVSLGYNYIDAPATLKTFRTDDNTQIADNAWTNLSTVVSKATIAGVTNGDVLTPSFEVRTSSSGWTGVAATPLGVTATGTPITYNGSTMVDQPLGSITGLSPGNTYYWRVRLTDQAGRASAWSAAYSYFQVEQTAPSGTVSIGGANVTGNYAKSTSVTLTSTASDSGGSGLAQMRFSNDGTTWPAWETYNATKNWTLSSGDGAKKVYVQYKDWAGNVSGDWIQNTTANFAAGNRGTDIALLSGSAGVYLLKQNGMAASVASECVSNYIAGGVCAVNPWVAGYAGRVGTVLQGKEVYYQNIMSNVTWGPRSSCVGPQCATGLDTNYPSSYALVSPQTNPGVGFTSYPAQNACRAIGGRLPYYNELQELDTGQASYGNNFGTDIYWSATEELPTFIRVLYFLNHNEYRNYADAVSYNTRCVKDTPSSPSLGGSGTAGTFISSTNNFTTSNITNISWSTTVIAGTKFQVATKDADSGWVDGDFKGPDGTTGTYFSSSGGSIPASFQGHPFVRYKAYLSNNGGYPVLSSVTIQSAVSASITLDTQAPTGTVVVNTPGATYTTNKNVTLYLDATEHGASGLKDFELSNDGNTWGSVSDANGIVSGTWQPYLSSYATGQAGYSWNLIKGATDGGTDGARKVYVRYRDNAGNIGGDYYPNWTAGQGAISNISVYNADISPNKAWQTTDTACSGPQCVAGLDGSYPSNNALSANNDIDFSAFPARDACKAIGGRLPTMSELGDIYSNKSTYGNNFATSATNPTNYWSGTEFLSGPNIGAYQRNFSASSLAGSVNWNLKTGSYYTRCVRDNLSSQTAILSNITLDTTLPTTALTTNPLDNDGANGWFKTNPTITLTATKEGSSEGIQSVVYKWGSANEANDFLDTGTSTYSSSFDMNGAIGEGVHTLYYRSRDVAGHVENMEKRTFKLDTTKPLTGYAISPASPNGSSSWYVGSTPQITLTPADAGGANASGVATTKYQWDSTSGSWSTGTSISMIQGDHVLYYYATDNAGNDEFQYEQQHIKFDNVKPLNPTNFTAPLAESSTDTIVLHWDASLDGSGSGAVDYQVRRKKDTVLSWNDPSVWTSGQLGNVQIYHDNTGLEAGYKYNYQIRALDAAGNWEDWPGDGTKTVGYTIDNQAPSNPTNVTAVACDGTLTNCSNISYRGSEIKLTWSISNDNGLGMGPDSDLKVGHYKIWRSTTPSLLTSDWSLIGVKDGGSGSIAEWYDNNTNNAATFDIGVYPPTDTKHDQVAGKTLASTALNDYTQYYYRVTALDVINNESSLIPTSLIEQDLNKNVSPVATPDVTAPTQPAAVTATSLGLDGSDTNNPALENKHQRVVVNWAPSVDCKALVVTCNQSTPFTDLGIGGITYKVYRSTTNYATRDEWLASSTLATTTSAETYEDNGRSDTTTYYYRVMASDSDGNPSLLSSVDPNSSTRTFNSNVPSAPADVVVSSQKGAPNSDATVGDKITASFKGSNSKGDQIVKYEIYRYKSDTNDLTVSQWLDTSRTTKLKLTSTGACGNQCLSFSTGTTGSDISITPNQADRDSSYQITDVGLDDASTYFYRVRAQDNANVPNQPDQSNRFGPLSSITSLNSSGGNKFGWDITPDASAPDQPSGLKVKDIHDDGLNFKRNIVTWSRIATPTRNSTNDFREYRIYRSDDGLTWSQICKAGTSTTLLASCTVNNPNPLFNADKELSLANNYYMDLIPISAANQFYYYYVTSVDDAGSVYSYQNGSLINSGYFNESKVALDSQGHKVSVSLNPAIAQPSICDIDSNPCVVNSNATKAKFIGDIGVSSATIAWATDQPTDTIVEFRKHGTDNPYIGVVDRSMVTAHQITAKPLEPHTQYDYRVISRNSLANDVIAEGASLPTLKTSGFTITPGTVTTTTSTAEIKWTTNLDASSAFVEYQLQTQSGDQAQGGTSGVEPTVLTSSPQSHDVVIKGLRSNRTYTFKIKSISKDGYLAEYPAGAFSNFKTRNFDSAQFSLAPSSSNVADRNITSTTAQIIWQTANEATSWVDYGTASGVFGTSAGNDTLTTTHVVTLEGLVPGTTYYYHVRAKDENEVEFTSQEYSFTAVIKPKISNMQVKDVSPYSVTIAWDTNVDTETVLNWGTTSSYGSKQGTGGSSRVHQVTVNNLEDNTEYHYQIVAHDAVGNEVVGADGIVRTPLDTSGPKISNAKIDVLPMGENDTTGTIIVSWQTDKAATTLVEYGQGILGGDYNNKSVEDTSLNTTHTVIIKNLQPASSYHYRMVSADKRNNLTHSDDYTFVTPSKEKSIIELIVKSLEDTFAWTRNLNQFFGNLAHRFTAGK